MSSGVPSMFKTPRHRRFDYKPVIYDEQKERKAELEQLVAENRSGELSDKRRRERLRGKLNHRWSAGNASMRKQHSAARAIRLITVIAILVGLLCVVFFWG